MIVGACLQWYSIDYQIKTKFSCNFLDFLAFFSFACLCVFHAVVPVTSTALHSLTLVCLYFLHGTIFPWVKIKDIKVNKIFKHFFLLWNFAC